MKKTIVLLAIATTAIICSSCASTFEKVNQTMVRVQEPEVGSIATPIIMELGEIPQQKITDTTIIDLKNYQQPSSRTYSPYSRSYPNRSNSGTYQRITQSMLIEFRKEALEKAVIKHDCDVIVYPSFRIITSDDGKRCYIILSGYPAKYKKIRPATKDDLWMLEFMDRGSNLILNNVRYEESEDTQKPTKRQ